MRLVDCPDLPEGAIRVFGSASMTPPEGAAQVVANSNGLFVTVGTRTISVDRPSHSRVLLHLDAELAVAVAVAPCGVVFVACARAGATLVYRWDIARGSIDLLCEVPQKCEHLATDPGASRIAIDWHGRVVVCDGRTGELLWTRDAGDLYVADDPDDPDDRHELEEPTREIAIEDDAVVLYKYREDRDDPSETHAIARSAPPDRSRRSASVGTAEGRRGTRRRPTRSAICDRCRAPTSSSSRSRRTVRRSRPPRKRGRFPRRRT